MPLQKQNVNINFSQGLDTKTDPWQVTAGKMLSLENTIFDKGGLLQKRNGYQALTSLPVTSSTTLTTYSGSLIAIGDELNVLSQDTMRWYDKGNIQPVSLSVIPIARSSTSQTTIDTAVAPNGLCCGVFNDSSGNAYYQIVDSETGQIIVSLTQLPASSNDPRVFSLGNYFIITFLVTVSSATHFKYISIPILDPQTPSSPNDVSSQAKSLTAGYDGYVKNNSLYFAFNGSDGGGAIHVYYLDSTLVLHTPVVISSHNGDLISVTADVSSSINVIWITFWDSSSNNAYTAAFDTQLNPILTSTLTISSIILSGLTSIGTNGVLNLYYQTNHTYSYSSVRSDFVSKKTCTQVGTVGSPIVVMRGVGLSSKVFYFSPNETIYFLAAYGGSLQPTYFLIDENGTIISKLAYSNGSGYPATQILASVHLSGNDVQIGYLFKDLLVSVNKTQGVSVSTGIYSQTGGNLSSFIINDIPMVIEEIANALHMAAGFLWMYDGSKPVEHSFHVWPEDLGFSILVNGGGLGPQQYFYQATYEWTDAQGNLHRSAPSVPLEVDLSSLAQTTSFTSVFSSGVTSIVVSALTNLYVGQVLTDVTTGGNLAANTTIIGITPGTNTLTLSAATLGNSAVSPGDTISAVVPPLTFHAIFADNVTLLSVSSTSNLFVGQVLTDTTTGGNLSANTFIVSIDTVHTTITINQPTLGASASSPGDVLQTIDTLSVTVDIPTLRLTAKTGQNPVRLVLYRWSVAQQIYYQDTLINAPVLNDVTVDFKTFTDKQPDASILGNVILYTTGGVVEDIAAPACSVQTLFKSRLVLVDSEDPNLLWYSKQVIENTPVEMSDLFTIYVAPTISAQGSTGPITALSAMDDKLIIFKKDAIYYLTGDGPDNTGANSDFSNPIFITSTVGCSNQQSIVFMPQGLMFQSDKGIWLLGRDLSTNYIGAPVEAFNNALVESALNVPATNQVRLTLNNGITLMYDYYYGQWGTFTDIPALSSTIYQGLHTYLNSFGQVFQETPGLYLDGSNPVLMSFTSAWFNLAGLQGYERAYFFYILGNYITPHKLNVQISYDYNPYATQTSLIVPINFTPNYGNDPLYGSSSPYGGSQKVEQWRVFLQTQKCESFQITISEIYDPSFGVMAGAGLTISGLDLIVGTKSGYPRLKASLSIG